VREDEHIWQLKGLHGEEAWRQESSGFVPVKVSGREYDPSREDLDILFVKKCPSGNSHGNEWFPSAFLRCPRCGGHLTSLIVQPSPEWAAPHGNPDGTRTFPDLVWLPPDSREKDFPLPKEGGRFGFVVCGERRVLLAIDREYGQVYSYSLTRRDWLLLGRIPHGSSQPSWSWSAFPTSGGIVVPTDQGPFWVSLPGPGEVGSIDGTSGPPASSVGGAIAKNGFVFIPVTRDENLFVAWRPCKPEGDWKIDGLNPSPTHFDPGDFLGSPVKNGGGDLFWAGKTGFLSVSGEGKGFRASWNAWPEGHTGTSRCPIYLDHSKAVWQLCFDQADRHYLFVKLTRSGIRESFDVRGPHVSMGSSTFMGEKLYEVPWEENFLDFYPGSENVIHPVAALKNGILFLHVKNEISTKRFLEVDGRYEVNLVFRKNDMRGEKSLIENMTLANPWDLSIFFYNGALYVYKESKNECCFFDNAVRSEIP